MEAKCESRTIVSRWLCRTLFGRQTAVRVLDEFGLIACSTMEDVCSATVWEEGKNGVIFSGDKNHPHLSFYHPTSMRCGAECIAGSKADFFFCEASEYINFRILFLIIYSRPITLSYAINKSYYYEVY